MKRNCVLSKILNLMANISSLPLVVAPVSHLSFAKYRGYDGGCTCSSDPHKFINPKLKVAHVFSCRILTLSASAHSNAQMKLAGDESLNSTK
jgi:hypothetical protein